MRPGKLAMGGMDRVDCLEVNRERVWHDPPTIEARESNNVFEQAWFCRTNDMSVIETPTPRFVNRTSRLRLHVRL